MITAYGLGNDVDWRGAVAVGGYTRKLVGAAPPGIPIPYGGDNTERILRHDRLQWARRRERIDRR